MQLGACKAKETEIQVNETELSMSAELETDTNLSMSDEPETDINLSMAGMQANQLQLNDLSMYEEGLQEDLEGMQELYNESARWKEAGVPLEESDYSWISDARELLTHYFQKTYRVDLSEQVEKIEVWTSDAIPETIGGFSDGTGKIFLPQEEMEQYEQDETRMCHTTLHEMIHAVGVDFYNDKSGLRSSAFYEGLTEALTKAVIEDAGEGYEDISTYGTLLIYSGKIMEADPQLVVDLVSGKENDIAARIDKRLGTGTGKELLDAQSLIEFSYWDEGSAVYENCERITDAYAGEYMRRE